MRGLPLPPRAQRGRRERARGGLTWIWLLLAACLVGAAGLATAASRDARGWLEGSPAAGTADVLAQPEPTVVRAQEALRGAVTGPTVLVFLSTTCPHCQAVAPELARLHARLRAADGAGRGEVLGVVLRGPSSEALDAFRRDHGADFPLLADASGALASAFGVTGTPTVFLVRPEQKGRLAVLRGPIGFSTGSAGVVELHMRAAAGGDPFAALSDGVVGARTCGACHVEELASWALTHHAGAWATLQRARADTDTACVGCHVTGATPAAEVALPGGFDGTPATAHLRDVGCEACHGVAGPHDGVPTDPASTCVGCHDAKHSIAFSVPKGLPHIDHFAASHLTEAAWHAKRADVLAGALEQPLLAFADDVAWVGSASCAGCHPAETTHWLGTPHATAMARLSTQEAGDAGCVRCHATPTASGMPSEDVATYRREESVGCEACHGPGGQHVQDQRADSIVGLGDSCPVCVVEAVCTRCHTAAQDPDWNLATGLLKARHPRAPGAASERAPTGERSEAR